MELAKPPYYDLLSDADKEAYIALQKKTHKVYEYNNTFTKNFVGFLRDISSNSGGVHAPNKFHKFNNRFREAPSRISKQPPWKL